MAQNTVNLRLFGCLHALRTERGLPTKLTVEVPTEGISGTALAESLDLPLDLIEGLFCNHTVRPLSWVVHPGDEVAFVPVGTPGPHRFFLGLYKAGQESAAAAADSDANVTNGTS